MLIGKVSGANLTNRDNSDYEFRSLNQYSKLNINSVISSFQSSIGKRRRGSDKNLLRIYSTNSAPVFSQLACLEMAIEAAGLYSNGWKIEKLTAHDLRCEITKTYITWQPKDLVDWLLDSDIHFVLGQGLHNGMIEMWKPMDCIDQLQRLQYHVGYPSGTALFDPVLTADKMEYLYLASEVTNPSMKIILNEDDVDDDDMFKQAEAFMEKYNEGAGFILKAPFVQNCQGFPLRYPKSLEQLRIHVNSLRTKVSGRLKKGGMIPKDVFPYIIMQPFLRDHAESKVLFYGSEPKYICSTAKHGILGRYKESEIMNFVKEAHELLKSRVPLLCDNICRVDIMTNTKGKMVVNEFENLDSQFA